MTTTYAEARDCLKRAVESTGLPCLPYWFDSFDTPQAFVMRREFDPRLVFSQAKAEYLFRIRVITGRTQEQAAQELLDEVAELSGAKSILLAVQDDDFWSAAIDYAQVTSIAEPATVEIAGEVYLVQDFEVEVVF